MPVLITSSEVKLNENALYHFKKEFYVGKLYESKVKVYADARYKLYVNDVLVAVGPCKQTSETKYYDVVDVTDYIKKGSNIIDVRVLQLANELYSEKDALIESVIRSGNMIFCMWGNIGDVEFDTNEEWKVAKINGIEFFCEPFFDFYNVTSLSESISSDYGKNLMFKNAVEVNKLYSLPEEMGMSSLIAVPAVERPIPMMYFEQRNFVDKFGDIYDAGKVTCGYIRFKCKGKGKVCITYAEGMSFIEEGKVIKRKRDDRSGVIIGNYDILEVDGECLFEPFWMRTFRYAEVKLEGDITTEFFEYIETGYPLDVSEKYDFGNKKDNKLFEISVNTLRRCMHETYMDCPYYEQLQYAMDTHLQMLFTYQLTDDKRLPEKAIDDFAKSYRIGGLTQSRFPTNKAQYIPCFSLVYVLMLYEHYKRFADKDFVRKYICVADGVADWFIRRLDGYMVSNTNLWDFVDWSEEYDFGRIPERKPGAVYSMMFAYTLERLSELHNFVEGHSREDYIALSVKIKNDVKERCFDEEKGLYADSPEKTHYAQHPQIWAVLCGMETGENAKNILFKSMNLKCRATSSYMFFLFRAMEKANIYDMSAKNMDELRSLVDLGCTTTPEWIGEDVRSECHAWSAVAIYEFTAKVLGVVFMDNTICIEPYICGRDYARGEVATPKGAVLVDWTKKDGEFVIRIDLPCDLKAKLTMPDGQLITAESGTYRCRTELC